MPRIAVTGSLAYDYIMNFPGHFREHILPEKVHMLTVSFLVDSMKRLRGGTAGNIAYNLALMGEKPLLVASAGQDFNEYRQAVEPLGVDTSAIKVVDNEFTASCFINTDLSNNQIVAFYPGAANHARELSLDGAGLKKDDWALISPTDPVSMARHTQDCKRLGVKYIFDPGKQTPRLDKAQILAGLDGCALLVGNDYEFGMMAKMVGWTEDKLIASAPITVVTRGEEGSWIFDNKAGKKIEVPIAKPKATVDPTGCGDAYIAGFTFALARGLPLEVSGRIAALLATYCLELKGCQEHRFAKGAFATRYAETFGGAKELDAWAKG
jgi:adenosine kinase